MSDVTRILSQIESGDPSAAGQLLPLVYDELRKLAAAKLAHEKPGQTLQATALVHEAYVRLVGGSQQWDSRGHFFSAAAEAMRRILVDNARRKLADKRGAGAGRVELAEADVATDDRADEVLAVHEALDRLAEEDDPAASVVKLRYFAGLTMEEAASAMGISRRQAQYLWSFARSWLRDALRPK
jgi:RNA polymerase sigma factor (TIGR02999 family)